MWIMTRSDWPVLVNLARTAQIGYQQVTKFDPKTRVIAAMWEQEIVLAECPNGDEARALVALIGQAIAVRTELFDLREIPATALQQT